MNPSNPQSRAWTLAPSRASARIARPVSHEGERYALSAGGEPKAPSNAPCARAIRRERLDFATK
jgi:hypothetical protein